MIAYDGRIVEIQKKQDRGTYVKQGINKEEQIKYSNYPGDMGTYAVGGQYMGTELIIKIFVYDLERCICFDVYDELITIANVSKISTKMLKQIYEHEGKKVKVFSADGNDFKFDVRVLLQNVN